MVKEITGNYFNKYESKNPLVRYVMEKYFKTFYGFLSNIEPKKILDVGCGEGKIIEKLKKKFPKARFKGYDIDKRLINSLKKRYKKDKFEVKYVDKDFKEKDSFDLVLCLEVLEHIKDYDLALRKLSEIKSKYIIISVPNEPLFRIANISRLKYLKDLGNTPGHVNNFSYLEFKKLIMHHFKGRKKTFKNSLIWNFAFIENEK